MASVIVYVCFFVINVHNLELAVGTKEAETHPHPATEFTKHALIKPRIYHGREKRQISTTKEGVDGHANHISLEYNLDGENIILDLRLNRELIPKGYFQRYHKNGRHVVNRPNKEDIDLCHYKGNIRGYHNSWAALSTCDNIIKGVVYDGVEMHYVETTANSTYLYKHSDIAPNNKTCGYSNSDITDHDHEILSNNEFNRILRYKRSTETLVRGPYNANKQSRYVELVLVVDNKEYKELGESTKRIDQHCKDIANIINGLYAPLNIYIALVGVVIWTEYDEITFSLNGDTTLTNFLHYRREKLIKEHPNDNAQLLTKNAFENGVVGKALKGPICTYEYSGGVNTDHSTVLGLVATTVAHEMGHNFGMEHDTNECKCPEERCIMAPSSSTVPPNHWSSCSLEYLALAFEHGMDYCLRNKPIALYDSPVCGNGFVEPGEQCDCGLPEHCDNTCCNATTCMLFKNASCATGECCDLSTCMPKNAGTLCRSADYECDLPEYCTGQSEYCPDDFYKIDTEVCDGGKAYCYNGFCRTRSDQCKLLWGNTGKSSDDQCYKMNTKGTRHGNCGYNKLNQSFFKCQDEHVLCGMLHCKHLNERLEFGMESVAILSHSFINLKGSIIACRTALVDLGLNQVDPGLAPDGARCGDGKMCVNQRCMQVESLRKSVGECHKDCNGNGVCNSLGHCHCKEGFSPPHCDYPGPGGSSDSGPATDPNAHKGFVTAMFIIFLGIIPMFALLAFLTYYLRNNVRFSRKKTASTRIKSPQKSRSPQFSPESPKRITEDNHSLLSEQQTDPPTNVPEFYGQFKGFTLTPIKKKIEKNETDPIRSAPPVPSAPSPPDIKIVNPLSQHLANLKNKKSSKNVIVNNEIAPALPPLNPGSHARPIISSPTLQNSTCTAKELLSPLKNAPKVPIRPAPQTPIVINDSTSTDNEKVIKSNSEEPKKLKENKGGINRITSFLKSRDKSLISNENKSKHKSINKDMLRSIEISNPIPQNSAPIKSVENEKKAVLLRTQSMRQDDNKPKLQSFGSMREPGKRPVSIVTNVRPKSPPPPAPQEIEKKSQNQYDDCLNSIKPPVDNKSPSSDDNIYAVIEESPIESPEAKPVTSSSTSNESFGLLGEIVSEIQHRNFDSIYSTSTLGKNKKNKTKAPNNIDSETYVNAPIYKSPESVYSNMNNIKSSASSTSSGYIHPSAVNIPVHFKKGEKEQLQTTSGSSAATEKIESVDIPKVAPKPNLSSFKTDKKPEISLKPVIIKNKDTNTTNLGNKKIEEGEVIKESFTPKVPQSKVLGRQITPPNLKNRKPSHSGSTSSPSIQKVLKPANSPDLVTSCSTKNNSSKAPDVLNNSVKKTIIKVAAKTNPKTLKPVSALKTDNKKVGEMNKPPTINKVNKLAETPTKAVPSLANGVTKQSNVASLQQRFESKSAV